MEFQRPFSSGKRNHDGTPRDSFSFAPRHQQAAKSLDTQLPSLRSILNPSQEGLPGPSPRYRDAPSNGASTYHQPDLFGDDRSRSYPPRHDYPPRNDSAHQKGQPPPPLSVVGLESHHSGYRPTLSAGAEPLLQPHYPAPISTDDSRQSVSDSSAKGTPQGHFARPPLLAEISDELDGPPLKRRVEPSSRTPAPTAQFMGERDIPGEGLCYVYADGTYCKTKVDGQLVNPSWGLTKAGKPRKRLAQACLTCREKKIKCEPQFPKCRQCAKSQRQCKGAVSLTYTPSGGEDNGVTDLSPSYKKFAVEPRSPLPPGGPAEWNASQIQGYQAMLVPPQSGGFREPLQENRPYAGDTANAQRLPDTGADSVSPRRSARGPDPTPRQQMLLEDTSQDALMAGQLIMGWDRDPFTVDPSTTRKLLDLYFIHIATATYCLFPRTPFMMWVETVKDKSADDKMALYSILAMGSVFAIDPDLKAVGKRFADIAGQALHSRFAKWSLQLCHARLMLGLYHFSRGRSQQSWDFSGMALRAISALRLNTEKGVTEASDDDEEEREYGFSQPVLEECRRRTFWSGFLMDRYNGFCGGTLCVINLHDVFVRIPGCEKAYEEGHPQLARFFDPDLNDVRPAPSDAAGAMGYLVLISAIWGDVLSMTLRAVERDTPKYSSEYASFHSSATARLDEWVAGLPSHLTYSKANLDNAISKNQAGTFISLHALHNASAIRLNRHVRSDRLSRDVIIANMRTAMRHAHRHLQMMCLLQPESRTARLGHDISYSFSTPFPGYAFLMSLDTLTAGGPRDRLPELMPLVEAGLQSVEELARFWASAKAQLKAGTGRKEKLVRMLAEDSTVGATTWRMESPLDTAFAKKDDLFYSTTEEVFFEAVGEEWS